MNTFTFVLPQDRYLPSGGNIYNEKLIGALQAAGHDTAVMDFAAYQAAIQQDLQGMYWVDSLFVKDMQSLLSLHPQKAKSFFILHHLESLHPPVGATAEQIFHRDEQAVLSFFDGFLVTSRFSEAYLRSRGFRQPIMTVEPAVEQPVFAPSPVRGTISALMVANIVERKGILDWLHYLSEMAVPSDLFTLTIVGRTDMEPAYALACKEKVVLNPVLKEKVSFTGSLPHHEVLRYYAQANLFISAARMETFGMALQEAKAYRIPILALEGGHVKHHINNGKNGYIFNSTAKMAIFFIDLVRRHKKFAALLEQTLREQPMMYTWQQAAALFFQQFNQFFKTL